MLFNFCTSELIWKNAILMENFTFEDAHETHSGTHAYQIFKLLSRTASTSTWCWSTARAARWARAWRPTPRRRRPAGELSLCCGYRIGIGAAGATGVAAFILSSISSHHTGPADHRCIRTLLHFVTYGTTLSWWTNILSISVGYLKHTRLESMRV